jgi:hypothetical protein
MLLSQAYWYKENCDLLAAVVEDSKLRKREERKRRNKEGRNYR